MKELIKGFLVSTTVKKIITVREYAQITPASNLGASASMNLGIVSDETFQWLLDMHRAWGDDRKVLSIENQLYIKLGSYIGYLEAPNGEGIEILPKTEESECQAIGDLRSLLQRMLRVSLNLPFREGQQAQLKAEKQPLHEWIFQQFLNELGLLLSKGLRFDYEIVEQESFFIRGQLDFGKQLNQTPDKAMKFHLVTSEFTPQRVENILIKTALCDVLRVTHNSEHWKLANRFTHLMEEIRQSANPLRDLQQWQSSKLLAHYANIQPWCRLILEQFNPHFQKGLKSGIAILFPMEKLFEDFVGSCLKKQTQEGLRLKSQKSTEYLVVNHPTDNGASKKFQLKPDFVLEDNTHSHMVLDTKWKLLRQQDEKSNYGISQADMYQLFAYGHKYLKGKGHLALIYPQYENFLVPLPVFQLDNELFLWCIPFDLHRECLSLQETDCKDDLLSQYVGDYFIIPELGC